jgi:hypothetical protein
LPTAKNVIDQATLLLSVSLSLMHTVRAHKKEKGEITRGHKGAMVGDKSKREC